MTITPVAARFAVKLSLAVLMTGLLRLGFVHPTFRMKKVRPNRLSLGVHFKYMPPIFLVKSRQHGGKPLSICTQ